MLCIIVIILLLLHIFFIIIIISRDYFILLLAIALSACLTTAAAGRACASWSLKVKEESNKTTQDHAAKTHDRHCRIFAGSILLQYFFRKCRYPYQLDRLRSFKRHFALGQRNLFSEPVTYRSATDCHKKWLHWSNVYKCHGGVSAVLVTREALVQIFGLQDVSVRRAPGNLQYKTKRNFYRVLSAPETQPFDPTWHVSVKTSIFWHINRVANWLRRHESTLCQVGAMVGTVIGITFGVSRKSVTPKRDTLQR